MWIGVVLVLLSFCCVNGNPSLSSNVLDIAANLGATKFLDLVNRTGLTVNLTQHAHLTVFVPSNEAFDSLPQEQKDNLNDPTYAREILLYHVIPENLLADTLKNEAVFKTLSILEGDEKPIKVRINIYGNGQIKTVSGSPIVGFDHLASNGVVHVISRVLYKPPVFGSVAQVTFLPITRYMQYGLIDGGLAEMLNGKEPYTLFAPTDLAFEALPNKTLNILHGNTTAIRRVMENHIIKGTYFSAGLTQNTILTTMLGENLAVSIKQGNVTVNGALLVIPDFTATNGVVHFTNKVFLPKDLNLN